MQANSTYFHQGIDLFEHLEPVMKQVSGQVSQLAAQSDIERKAMEERHLLVQKKVIDRDLSLNCNVHCSSLKHLNHEKYFYHTGP
jgi:hypothetical protein